MEEIGTSACVLGLALVYFKKKTEPENGRIVQSGFVDGLDFSLTKRIGYDWFINRIEPNHHHPALK